MNLTLQRGTLSDGSYPIKHTKRSGQENPDLVVFEPTSNIHELAPNYRCYFDSDANTTIGAVWTAISEEVSQYAVISPVVDDSNILVFDSISINWFLDAMDETPDYSPDAKRLAEYIDGINSFIANRASGLDALSKLFQQIEPSKLSTPTAVAFLRSTFPFREKIFSWRRLLTRTSQEFLRRKLPVERLLAGLR